MIHDVLARMGSQWNAYATFRETITFPCAAKLVYGSSCCEQIDALHDAFLMLQLPCSHTVQLGQQYT